MKITKKFNFKYTIYAKPAGPYNILSYNNHDIFKQASKQVHEMCLHKNFIEWGKINKFRFKKLKTLELNILWSCFKYILLIAHRDINYTHNSLQWIEKNWNFSNH